MNVHNMMEEIVNLTVNQLYDHVKSEKVKWLSCDCENCRLDTVSYVLNRIPPKYVVSGRGVAHTTNELENGQVTADIEAIAMEGMRIVSSTKRPFHTQDRKNCTIQENDSPAFNFCTFTGTVLDGNSFEPIPNATILLKCEGNVADMVDMTWSNPYTTVKSTNGSFSFWMKSLPAESENITKQFNFSIEVSAAGYSEQVYHFDMPITSEARVRNELNSVYSVKLPDIVLFK